MTDPDARAYNDLAWTEEWLADPSVYEAEAGYYARLLLSRITATSPTLLDGIYDEYLLGDGAYPMQVFVAIKPDSGEGVSAETSSLKA